MGAAWSVKEAAMHPADLLPAELSEMDDPLLDSAAELERAARMVDLEGWIVQRIKHAEREVTVALSFERATGESLGATGILVQHCRVRGPCVGPVLLSPDLHTAYLRALATHVTLQCALLELPVGGSAGGIVCDPSQLTESELRGLIQDYLWALRDIRGSHASVLAPAECISAWTHHLVDPAAIAAKPAELGGIPDAPAAVATGWFTLISETLSRQKGAARGPQLPATTHQLFRGLRVALQGFGPAAARVAAMLSEAGARILCIADKSGGLFAEHGLQLAAIGDYVRQHGMLYGFPEAEPVRNTEVLESGCDLLVTAAAERQITAQNAGCIRAPLVLEAVYNAVTPAAARLLESRGATLIPAMLGTAPALLAWVAEWQHALRCSPPKQAQVEQLIRDELTGALQRVLARAAGRRLSLSDACRLVALEKLGAAFRLTR